MRRNAGGRLVDERREADRFLADLLGTPQPLVEAFEIDEDADAFVELVEGCGFFGPNDVRRTEQEVRDAVVARATAEWTAWHTAAGAPRTESETGMYGRLVGYYLAAEGAVLPDTLTWIQATALGLSYTALMAATGGA